MSCMITFITKRNGGRKEDNALALASFRRCFSHRARATETHRDGVGFISFSFAKSRKSSMIFLRSSTQ